MPNRYIREGIITSEAVCSLSWLEEVFYRRLLNKVDDFGRFTAHPALLRASLFPLQLDRVREADIPRLLAACEDAGLVFAYQSAGKPYLVVNKWEKGRAKESNYPAPPADVCERMKTFAYRCKQVSADVCEVDSDANETPESTNKMPRAAKPQWSADGGWLNVTDDHKMQWKSAYPACDIDLQLLRMEQWLKANPAKAKKSNWLKFITGWLTRQQDKGGDMRAGSGATTRGVRNTGIPVRSEEMPLVFNPMDNND